MIWNFDVVVGADELSFQQFTDNNIYAGWNQDGSDQRIVTASNSTAFANGTWKHYLFTWDDAGDLEELYINNSLFAQRSAALAPVSFNSVFSLGRAESFTALIDGDIADVAYYTSVPSSGDRSSLAAGRRANWGGLSVSPANYWTISGGSGTATIGGVNITWTGGSSASDPPSLDPLINVMWLRA
jgi:hypothetical protein